MPFKTPDGSIVDYDGRFLFMSIDRFVNDICKGDCCFICGARRGPDNFNDEHVIPDWLLRRHNLRNLRITLPNLTEFRYGSYLVPCCKSCNSEMGKGFETPVSQLFSGGVDAIADHLQKDGSYLLFTWLCLIFLKTHLKDARLSSDMRAAASGKIGDAYEWEELHHVHAIARSFHSGASINATAFGSLMVFALKPQGPAYFDFVDSYEGQAIGICSGDIAIIAVLNDSCGAYSKLATQVATINEGLTPIQFRELFARAAYLNIHLKNRPVHRTGVDFDTGDVEIISQCPALCELEGVTAESFGAFFERYYRDMFTQLNHDSALAASELELRLRNGTASFIFDANGQFIPQR